MKRRQILTSAIASATILLATVKQAGAANFSITSGTNNTARTLSANETGSVSSGATLSISGSTVGITLNATSGTTTITNSGSILQTGTGRTINNTAGTHSVSITNNSGALIRSADADTIRASVAGSNWSINNTGTISSLNPALGGSQALDLDAVATGTVSITNNAGGQILAFAADAIRTGANATVINAGTITATQNTADAAPSADGIDTQLRSGVSITNTGSITGRHGITGGDTTYAITVTNNAGGVITGSNGSGVNIDGVFATATANVTNAFGATIQGSVAAAFANGDGDGVDVDGVLTLNNSGNIFGYGAKGAGSDTLPNGAQAVSIGGGTITNTATGQIIGSSLLADAPNGDTTRLGEGILADNSSGGNAVAATTVTNDGLIRGKSGAGIRIIGTFDDIITNNATGTIQGAGTGAAIQTGGGNDIINNAGTITGDNGLAIDMGAGNNTLNIIGGTITGSINGGTGGTNVLNIDVGNGNTFTSSGEITNFSTMKILSGSAALSGQIKATVNGTLDTGGSTLTLTGGIDKNGTVFTIKGGGIVNINTTGITGASANSDLIVDGTIVNANVANTYNGPTYIRNSGTLNATVANALPTANGRSAIIFDGTGTSALNLTNAGQAVASLTSAGPATINLNANTLTVGAASGSTTFVGSISGSGGSLTKDGASELILTGSSSYTGTTNVEAGKLTLASTGMITSNTFVSAGGTLAGSGTISGSVTIQGGGTFLPGNNATAGLSTITGGLTADSASILSFEIGGISRGTTYDAIDGLTSLALGGVIDINFISGFAPILGDTFNLFDLSGLTGSFVNNGYTFDFSDAALGIGRTWNTSQFSTTGSISVAPEPTRALLLLIALSATALRRRRKA